MHHHHLLNSHICVNQTYLPYFLDDNLVNSQVHVTYQHFQDVRQWTLLCLVSLLQIPFHSPLLGVLDHSLRLLLHWRWWSSCWHTLDIAIVAFASPSLFKDFWFCAHAWIFCLLFSFGLIAFSIKHWRWCCWRHVCLLAMDWARLISNCFWFLRRLLVGVWVFNQSPSWQRLASLGASSCART